MSRGRYQDMRTAQGLSLLAQDKRHRWEGGTQAWATNRGVQQTEGGSGVEDARRCENLGSVVDIRMEGVGARAWKTGAHTPTLQQVDHLLMLHSACRLQAIPPAKHRYDICPWPANEFARARRTRLSDRRCAVLFVMSHFTCFAPPIRPA